VGGMTISDEAVDDTVIISSMIAKHFYNIYDKQKNDENI
jgi:hypothetical protein